MLKGHYLHRLLSSCTKIARAKFIPSTHLLKKNSLVNILNVDSSTEYNVTLAASYTIPYMRQGSTVNVASESL